MKRIAILTCLKACQVCTGASCLAAWNGRKGGFAQYTGEDISLEAFCHCNGCDKDPETDAGIREKLERLQKIGVEVVHTGVCTLHRETKELCPTIAKIHRLLQQRGIQVVQGTH